MACAGNRTALLASTRDERCGTICQTFGSLKIGVERADHPRIDRKTPTMRVLADIFATIQLSGTFYFRTHFSPPWGTTVPRLGRAARFHYVARGRCWIRVEDGEPLELSTGDFVLVPGGASHVLADDPVREAPPLETVLEQAGYRGEGLLAVGRGDPSAATQLVCGHFDFIDGADHAILRALPALVRITAEQREERPWFKEVLGLLVRQAFNGELGAFAAIPRLSEILFIEAIRIAADGAPGLKRLLDGFSDARIGRAIALIHKDPGRSWTVENLAREVGMSRARFADRFQELIGVGPVGYLREWRLQRAAATLKRNHQTIGQIAHSSGYSSPSAFTRTFRERFGRSPKRRKRLIFEGGRGFKSSTGSALIRRCDRLRPRFFSWVALPRLRRPARRVERGPMSVSGAFDAFGLEPVSGVRRTFRAERYGQLRVEPVRPADWVLSLGRGASLTRL